MGVDESGVMLFHMYVCSFLMFCCRSFDPAEQLVIAGL